jgi:hypothetical protein
MSLSPESFVCECHKIDWCAPLRNGGIGKYRYLPEFGGGIHTQCVGPVAMPCQDKVNMKTMSHAEYDNVCKYIPGEEGSLFPTEVFDWLLSEGSTIPEGIPSTKIQ